MAVNPDPGVMLYPRIRKSPFFYASRHHGVALYSVYNHTYHPGTTAIRSRSTGPCCRG